MNCLALSQSLDVTALTEILSNSLKMKSASIDISNTAEDIIDSATGNAFIEIQQFEGDFPLWLNIHRYEDASDLSIAKSISIHSDIDCLIADDSVNPYSWILVSDKGENIKKVCLDVNQLDNFERMIINSPDETQNI